MKEEELREKIKEQREIVTELKASNEANNMGSLSSWFNGELYTLDWMLDLLEKAPPITGEA